MTVRRGKPKELVPGAQGGTIFRLPILTTHSRIDDLYNIQMQDSHPGISVEAPIK